MTDFAPHDQWLVGKDYVDYFFVAHNKMKNYLVSVGIPEDKVFASGIPLSNRFLMHFDKAEIKKSFNLPLDKKSNLCFSVAANLGLAEIKL